METVDLLSKINQKYRSMSKGQKLLANYITDNYDRAAFVTAAKMGRIVGVSESTVVRFAYALGYDGYPEMQRSLQEMIRNRLTTVQRIQLTSDLDQNDILKTVLKSDITNIRTTLESLDIQTFNTVVDALFSSKHIYIVGVKSAAPLAQFLIYYMNFIFDNIVNAAASGTDIFESLVRIGPEDMCIGISFPRYSARTVEALTFARGRGANVVAITDSMFSPIAELAKHVLIARSDMASFVDSLAAPLSLINALIVAASLRRKDEVFERFSQLEKIWGTHGVYMTSSSEFSKDAKSKPQSGAR